MSRMNGNYVHDMENLRLQRDKYKTIIQIVMASASKRPEWQSSLSPAGSSFYFFLIITYYLLLLLFLKNVIMRFKQLGDFILFSYNYIKNNYRR